LLGYHVDHDNVDLLSSRIIMSFGLFRQISSFHPTKPKYYAASPWLFQQYGYN
jgi:hypothetical protein